MSSDTPINEPSDVPMPKIRGYRLIRVINHGGMSTVYLGEQLALAREVAIKVMSPQALSDEVSRRRFENEVRTIARLEHPHVVRIHELGRTADTLPYYTMPFLARGHLGQRSFLDKDGRPDEDRVIKTLHQLLSALEYAHGRGVVHRDVKAENVLFDDNDSPLLADFGIALRRGFGPRVTAAGLAVGSTAYMAPEQARGEQVDGRADLYSLAVLGWEMLTGHLPYQAADALSMAVMHAQDPIPKMPPELRHWQRFMQRALAKQPDQRFVDVPAMRDALGRLHQRQRWPQAARVWARASSGFSGPRASSTVPVDGGDTHPAASGPGRRALWLAVALLALLATWAGLRVTNTGQDRFFRLDAPEVVEQKAPASDPTSDMLRPLPEANLQVALENARRQILENNLTSPAGDNAHDSVLAAWHDDPQSQEVRTVIGELTDALAAVMVSKLEAGDDAGAREYFAHVQRLGEETGTIDDPARERMRTDITGILRKRIERAAAGFDHATAASAVVLGRQLGLTGNAMGAMAAVAQAIPRRGEVLPDDPAGAVLGIGDVALSQRPVSRAEYTRFASATGRESTRCRERGSLLRVFAPRTWREPGFEQGDSEPVVCVSLADVQSYARWYSNQTGHTYRLPTASEARQTAAVAGSRPVALWLIDCGSSCRERRVAGDSWRNGEEQRVLPTDRGYDDVGFRLLREL